MSLLKDENDFIVKCNKTEESLPIEYNITGFLASARVSLMINILSASSSFKYFFFLAL